MIAPSITVSVNSASRRRSSAAGQPLAGLVEAALDRARPVGEIGGEQVADVGVGLVQLERQAADRAAIGAIGGDELQCDSRRASAKIRSIGSSTPLPGGLQQPFLDAVAIGFEHRGEHVLLAREEMIEAAAVHLASG